MKPVPHRRVDLNRGPERLRRLAGGAEHGSADGTADFCIGQFLQVFEIELESLLHGVSPWVAWLFDVRGYSIGHAVVNVLKELDDCVLFADSKRQSVRFK